MNPPPPSSIVITDLESLSLQQVTDWFRLRLHGLDSFRRADPRLEEQEGDLLLDTYQLPDLSKETRRRFRLAAVACLREAVETGPDSTWSPGAIEDLCCIIPALAHGEEEEDAIAGLLLVAMERWPWISESRIRLKRQAMLTLGDLSWQLVRVPCPDREFWEHVWTQEAGDEWGGRKHDFVGEAAGAIFSGIERSKGIAAAFDWLGRARWRGDYNADLIRKLIPSRKQALGADALMRPVCDHLIPAMEGDDAKENVLIEAMTQTGLSLSPHFFECLLKAKSAVERTLSTLRRAQINNRVRHLMPDGIEDEKSMIELVASLLRNDSTIHSHSAINRILQIIANAIRSSRRESKIPNHSEIVSELSIHMASILPSHEESEALPCLVADIYEQSIRLHRVIRSGSMR